MSQPILVQDIVRIMDTIAPPHLALPKDKIGLQIGRMDKPVRRIWVALEASVETVHAAAASDVDLLVTHHAPLFHPIAKLDTATARGKAIQTLLANDLAVFNAHTNLDVAPGGVNDVIAERIGLTDVEILDVTYREPLFNLVVYVPRSHTEAVREAIGEAGAGAIGRYSHCTFAADGIGTFRPETGATPYIGTVGKLEYVEETRIETVVPDHLLSRVTKAMTEAHPYEEVAYDVIPMHQTGSAFGIGRVGNLATPMPLHQFASHAKTALGMQHIRFAGAPDTEVTRVAVLGGSGSRWVGKSIAKGAQVLLTSDVGHHEADDAVAAGIAVVDATHAALEQPVCAVLADRIKKHVAAQFGQHADEVEVTASPIDVDPFTWL